MVTLLNFGDSPFTFLFFLVLGITASVIVINVIAYCVAKLIDRKTKKILRAKR